MENKYGNDSISQKQKLPNGFHLENGAPAIANMMLPSDETVEKILKPFNWVKDRVSQSMEDGILSPFPKIIDQNPESTKTITDLLEKRKGGESTLDEWIIIGLDEISYFLEEEGTSITTTPVEFGGIQVNFYKNGVYHNQKDVVVIVDY